jgi:hypothetical protein
LGAPVRRFLTIIVALSAGFAATLSARAQGDAPLKFNCVIKDAQLSASRTHVRCANKGLNGLSEFAAETNQPYASRVAAAIVQALRTGSTLVLTYAPAAELNPDGCHARRCRKIIDVGGNGRTAQPALAPSLNAPEPKVQPADFDPVDAIVEDPSLEGQTVTPPEAPTPLAPSNAPMQPVPN